MDKAHIETDQQLARLEEAIKEVYLSAYKTAREQMIKLVDQIDLNKDMTALERRIAITKYNRLKTLTDKMTTIIRNANIEAMKEMNMELIKIYGNNHNFANYELEHETGLNLNFAVYDKEAIKKILAEETPIFTKLALDNVKDKARIYIELSRGMAEGLILGESIPKLAKRIMKVIDRNMSQSIRIARTETTRVQNAGRLDGYKKAEKLGIQAKKRWISTKDNRTRHSHAVINGQLKDLDSTFSNGLRFPGDELGPAKEVINCRCTMVLEIVELTQTKEEKKIDKELFGMSFTEWKERKGIK